MSFNKTVLTVATVIFVIMLTITALMIKKSYKNQLFPPEIPKCPDFWEAIPGNKCQYKGKNPGPDGSIAPSYVHTFPAGNTMKNRVEKCKWSKKNGVMWDGVWDGVTGVKGC